MAERIDRFEFEVDYPPSTNNLYPTVNGRRVKSREAKAYQESAAWAARVAGVREPLEGSVVVEVVLESPATRRRDIDNALKALFDAFTGVCWRDDSQVDELHAFKRPGGTARCFVKIEARSAFVAEGDPTRSLVAAHVPTGEEGGE